MLFPYNRLLVILIISFKILLRDEWDVVLIGCPLIVLSSTNDISILESYNVPKLFHCILRHTGNAFHMIRSFNSVHIIACLINQGFVCMAKDIATTTPHVNTHHRSRFCALTVIWSGHVLFLFSLIRLHLPTSYFQTSDTNSKGEPICEKSYVNRLF